VLIGGPGLSGFSGDSGSVVLLVFVWAAWCGSDRFLVFCSVWFCSVFGVVLFGVWCGSVRCGVRVQQVYTVCGVVWCTGADQKLLGQCCECGLVL